MKTVKRIKKIKKIKKKGIKTSHLYDNYIGIAIVVDPENSLIASRFNIKEPGKYALREPKKAKKKVKQVKKKKPKKAKKEVNN